VRVTPQLIGALTRRMIGKLRLTTSDYRVSRDARSPTGRVVAAVWVGAVMALVFAIDRLTDLPGVQHLYYFPIIYAAIRFGMAGGAGTALLAIVLYHVANPQIPTWRHEESDVLQMAVFIAAGLVAAKLAADARRLRRLALTDDLTGLHNLRSFEAELRRMVRDARQHGAAICVLVLDVDRLKSLNDTHGHLVGAEAVRTVGHIIGECLPAEAVACRYGGDEFAIALPRCTAVGARRVADDIRATVQAAAPVLGGDRFPARTLSVSIGLASRSFDGPGEIDGDDVEALFRSADAALYTAKNSGRNRVQIR
jgi:diguanylate cyclase (GGDEF)-like protein